MGVSGDGDGWPRQWGSASKNEETAPKSNGATSVTAAVAAVRSFAALGSLRRSRQCRPASEPSVGSTSPRSQAGTAPAPRAVRCLAAAPSTARPARVSRPTRSEPMARCRRDRTATWKPYPARQMPVCARGWRSAAGSSDGGSGGGDGGDGDAADSDGTQQNGLGRRAASESAGRTTGACRHRDASAAKSMCVLKRETEGVKREHELYRRRRL